MGGVAAAAHAPVVDCSHALQEKKDKEEAIKVKDGSHKTGEESRAPETCEASEESNQEEEIEEDILEGKSGKREENPDTSRATTGAFA